MTMTAYHSKATAKYPKQGCAAILNHTETSRRSCRQIAEHAYASEVTLDTGIGRRTCDRRGKTGGFRGRALLKEGPRVYLGRSCTGGWATLWLTPTPFTDAPGETKYRGAQNGLKHHPGLGGVHHAGAIAGVEAGGVDATGSGSTQRGSRNQVITHFCLLLINSNQPTTCRTTCASQSGTIV